LGSFSAAARALGLTQPTLGRQVAALEDELGVTLFERVGRELHLTAAGRVLADRVGTMGDAAMALSLSASGSVQDISGRVCISVSDMFAAHFLPDVLIRLRNLAPGLEIEIHASNDIADLQRREADIAIRHVRPSQPELIARLVHQSEVGIYAARSYLDKVGRPHSRQDLSTLEFISMGEPERVIEELKRLGVPAKRQNLCVISQSSAVCWEFTRRGLGVTLMVTEIGDAEPAVERLLPSFCPITVPFWLTVHRELHTSRKIRLVYDLLGDMLGAVRGRSSYVEPPSTGAR
ncbi:MAG: LysR family transcriptional regulator, partial [Paracoccaceae bacterium]